MKEMIQNEFMEARDFLGLGLLSFKRTKAHAEDGGGVPLKDLLGTLEDVKIKGRKKVNVTYLTFDSRKVMPGSLFFAVKGFKMDGNDYVQEAIRRGAVVIVTEDTSCNKYKDTTIVIVENVRLAMAKVAKAFYGSPDNDLELFGITGTNGKTTVSMLVQHFLQQEDKPVGLIGSIKYDLGKRALPSSKSTPEAIDLFALLDQMRQYGCKEAAMEVTSQGIALERVYGLNVNVGVFLNLTQDHLDFHRSMEDYYLEKRKLFNGETGNTLNAAVINIDDPYGKRLVKEVPDGLKVITVGASPEAMVRAENIVLTAEGTTFDLVWMEGRTKVRSGLLGRYNVLNILAALSVIYGMGRDVRSAITKLESFGGVRGRMEKVEEGQPFMVLVDSAHTDDALKNGLRMLKEITPKRILVVFGCGGNRDSGKRPKMTSVVQEYADFTWATADNPRREDLEKIFSDMKLGVHQSDKIRFIPDRRTAIHKAIECAREGDCILIAGKGHETYQEFADTVIPFDDCQVAREILRYRQQNYILKSYEAV